MDTYVLCSRCFLDQGLQLYAEKIGIDNLEKCATCGNLDGRKLSTDQGKGLAYSFFVRGSFEHFEFGAAPLIQFNEVQKTSVDLPAHLRDDAARFSSALGIGFFDYGPRLWMLGEIEPLKALIHQRKRKNMIERICKEYPTKIIDRSSLFYRVRKNISSPHDHSEYDAPPKRLCGHGRFDTKKLPILYGSQDLIVCIHECRVAAEDRIYVATLAPKRELKLLDLSQILDEENTEFESLDLAVHFLFLANENSYSTSRYVAHKIKKEGFDGLIYPSFFSLLRTGKFGFETILGLSTRRFAELREHEQSKIIPNLALFGRALEDDKVEVRCINRVYLEKVDYHVGFGPMLK